MPSASAKFRFMPVQKGSVETDPTQWDQFNTDELTAAEAVMRESHQNSLDAGPEGVVRTRISVHDSKPSDAAFFRELFAPLVPHLAACGPRFVPDDTGAPRFLVVEDFGTSGLLGRWDDVDELNFSDFWRRFGNEPCPRCARWRHDSSACNGHALRGRHRGRGSKTVVLA